MKRLSAAFVVSSTIGLIITTGLHLLYPDKKEFESLVIMSFIFTLISAIILGKEN